MRSNKTKLSPPKNEPKKEHVSSERLCVVAGIGLIATLSVLVYWPALHGGFVLDDDVLVTESKLAQAPDGLYKFWFTTEPIDYWPITNSSFWLEWRLWGSNPTGYHVTNLILHIVDAVLVWAVLYALKIPYAFLAALLFAVHPVNVQSVAWIAERKNVLSMLFFLLSLLCFLWSDATLRLSKTNRPRGSPGSNRAMGWYLLSMLSFLSAMLCKGSVAILPLLLILILWWQHSRLTRADWVRTIPFFVVAVLLTAVNIWFRGHGPVEALRSETFVERLLAAASVVWFYLGKAILPLQLSFIYPQWHVSSADLRWWLPLLAVLVTAVIFWSLRGRPIGKAMLFAGACFCVALLPVMGFIDVGFMNYSLVADHYQYFAIIPLLALFAVGLSNLAHRYFRKPTIFATACSVVVVGGLSLLSWQQSRLYAGPLVLYRDTIAKNPDSWMIRSNYANALANAGDFEQAIDQCREALRINPNCAEALGNLGMALYKTGRFEEAVLPLEQVVALQPNSAKSQYSLGTALVRVGRLSDAMTHLEATIRLDPNFPQAQSLYGVALEKADRLPEAIDHFEIAIQISPGDRLTRFNYGRALLRSHRAEEAITQLQEAVRIDPGYLEAWGNLITALANAGRRDEAILATERTIALARSMNQPEIADRLSTWLANYRATTPEPNRNSNETSP